MAVLSVFINEHDYAPVIREPPCVGSEAVGQRCQQIFLSLVDMNMESRHIAYDLRNYFLKCCLGRGFLHEKLNVHSSLFSAEARPMTSQEPGLPKR